MHRFTLTALSLAAITATSAFAPAAGAQATAVETPARNAAYLELLGSGGVFSINYERRVTPRVALRVGAGTWEGDDAFGGGTTSVTTFPITLAMLRGAGPHHLEAGGGILLGRKTFESSFGEPERSSAVTALSGLVGYRYQQATGGFLFRATFTPLLGLGSGEDVYPDEGVLPSAGVSFGWGW